jgi:hypothetical protein
MVSKPHNFEIGRWVRLLKGPHTGMLGQIIGRNGDLLKLLISGGPLGPVPTDISDVTQAYLDGRSDGHGP